MIKTKLMLESEKRLGRPLEISIPEAYQRLGSLEEVGKELGINPNTLYMWMMRLGIVRKVVLVQAGDNGSEEVSNAD